jgi:hypothetical protein
VSILGLEGCGGFQANAFPIIGMKGDECQR